MDNRNLIIAAAVSILILMGWEMFFAPQMMPPPAVTETGQPAAPPNVDTDGPSAPVTTPRPEGQPVAAPPPTAPAAEAPRLKIATSYVEGSISLAGGRIDDVHLTRYREAADPNSAAITLLTPAGSPAPYYAEFGWIASDASLKLPGASTVWTAEDPNAVLTDTTPVTLTWDNGEGLEFRRTIRTDKEYLFRVEQTVSNKSERAVSIFPYALVSRTDTPTLQGFFILHEGPIGVFNGTTLVEREYEELREEPKQPQIESTGGWIGITDKYWLTAIGFDPQMKVAANFTYNNRSGRDRYQTDLRGEAVALAPGEQKLVNGYVFAGAKELELLDRISIDPGLTQFDLAIDFGWFYFLTKPFFYALRWLHGILGNFGLAIIAFSTFLRLLMFPIANKQFKAMNHLKRLQPEMKKLQERYGNDRVKMNEELMALYKREKANPLSGCLPILLQIPIFFALYKVLFVTIEMRHAPFYGWIKDLSAPDPTGILTVFGLVPWDVPSFLAFLNIGIWPIIMGVTMFLQQKLAPQPADPVQAKVMMFLPVIFTFMMGTFPAGLVIYWAWSNLLGILQQWVLLRSEPEPAKK
ncbi:MAG: membrane protein insertase YidC [Rhodospirillaceae bacterium]